MSTAGLLAPAVAHAQEPGAVAAPPAAIAPAPAPAAPAPAPVVAPPAVVAPAPAPVPAAPAPAPVAAPEAAPAPTPAEAAPAAAPTAVAAPVAAAAPAVAAPAVAAPTTGSATTVPTTREISSGSLALPGAAPATGTATPPGVATPGPGTVAGPSPAPDPYVHVPFDIGLFPALSINGSHRNQKIRNTISLGLGWTRTDQLEGVAAALGATLVDEDASGITGALAANITRGEHRGIQFANGYNHAGSLRGVQMGAINHANEARGVQSGIINVTRGRIRGVQFGLVSYAEEADASFALIPVTKKGGVRPEVWTSDTAAINVGLRLPANYTYAFFAGGLHPVARTPPPVVAQADRLRAPGLALMAGMGFGGHLPVTDDVGLDADVSGWVVTSGLRAAPPLASLGTVRAMVSWQLRPRLAVWGGPTFNVMVERAEDGVARPGYGWVAGSHEVDDVRIRWWPGFAAGLRF
jgi:hypothetical protein